MKTEFEDKSGKKLFNYRELLTGYVYKLLNSSGVNSIIKAINHGEIIGVVLHNNSNNSGWIVLSKTTPGVDSFLFERVEYGEIKISW